MSYQLITISDSDSSNDDEPSKKKPKIAQIIHENKMEMNQKIADFITDLIIKNEEIIKQSTYHPRSRKQHPTIIENYSKKCDNNKPTSILQEKLCSNQKNSHNVNMKNSLQLSQLVSECIESDPEETSSPVLNCDNLVLKAVKGEIEVQCEIGTELYRDMEHLREVFVDDSVIFKDVGVQCEMGYEVLRAFS